ncbi:succinylglutamate desuccinylase/aspartoacylase family protein [Haloarcula onubensis]|uniref:Succinylglutamate desuccinylase/aspartoacylase family protein n=1 Tax=Haloarcula onubensis TaxID=2950539 RepID=A0ABU2FIW5_9EURY|nr:succinylglutamate desuccinylase/aspartoacylase family protein [Halomicroarcula sp. S3CR25-11]MDS0280705.1 succinylglutamate desuccinylase/aspartoacylase family protein [Halomicroarcula sp. S3CR25-11]
MEYEPVTHTATDRPLASLPSGSEVTVTVHRYAGGPGPTVYVQAAQHGIELNGPAALRRLHGRLVDAAVAGTVVVVPVVNPMAFDHRSYMTPPEYDVMNPNLNRVWPGDDEGSLQERLAARLWDLVVEADAVVDLHTGTADMLEHVRFGTERPAARRLGEAFGTEYLLTDDADADGRRGTFRAAAARESIPAITAELANSRQVAPAAVETGVEGVLDVLREVDALEARPTPSPDQTLLRDDPDSTTAGASGLFEPRPGIGVGDYIEAGEELGAVYSPSSFERRETVTAVSAGVAYSLTRESVVVAGERLASVARPV